MEAGAVGSTDSRLLSIIIVNLFSLEANQVNKMKKKKKLFCHYVKTLEEYIEPLSLIFICYQPINLIY